jgi:1-phosphofructokinase
MKTVVTVTPHPALDQTVRVANLAPGEVNRAESLEVNAGGKGVNVAACLADYGLATIATGLLGEEDRGAFEALFAAKHITDRFVQVVGRARINVKLVDPARGETTDINLPAARVTPAEVDALAARLRELAAPGRWFVLAGSLPPGVDAGFYRRAIAALRGAGAQVALDTSGAPLAEALSAGPDALPDLIKPNREELAAALGHALESDDAVLEAACALVGRGIARVVVSLGARGALGVTADPGAGAARCRVFRATPPAVPVASTVGAGDALVAGLVAGLVEGRPWDEVGRRATAIAAAKLARVGPHLPGRTALDALAERVAVETYTVAAPMGAAIQRAG